MRFSALALPASIVMLVFNCSPAGAQAAAQPTRAKPGEAVLLVLNTVRAEKKQQFENHMTKLWEALDKLSASDPEARRINAQTRVLRPAGANADGTFTYVFVMDPLIPGADYDMASILTRAFGEQESGQMMSLYRAAIVEERAQVFSTVQAER